jgi:hypothetical protein
MACVRMLNWRVYRWIDWGSVASGRLTVSEGKHHGGGIRCTKRTVGRRGIELTKDLMEREAELGID